MGRLMYNYAILGTPVVCMCGVYCGARINHKSKSTAQNVLGVKPKFKKNYITASLTVRQQAIHRA